MTPSSSVFAGLIVGSVLSRKAMPAYAAAMLTIMPLQWWVVMLWQRRPVAGGGRLNPSVRLFNAVGGQEAILRE